MVLGSAVGSLKDKSDLVDAARTGDIDLARSLLRDGANPNENIGAEFPLYVAAAYNNVTLIKLLIDNGADPNQCDPVQEWTSLHVAAYWGNIDACEVLLIKGAVPDPVTEGGLRPIDLAAKENHINLFPLFEKVF